MRKPSADDIVNAIASDTNTPKETVSQMYDETWAEYSEGARIKDFMPLLVAKRVRNALRHALSESAP